MFKPLNWITYLYINTCICICICVCIIASFIPNEIWKLKTTKYCKLGPLSLKSLEGVSYPFSSSGLFERWLKAGFYRALKSTGIFPRGLSSSQRHWWQLYYDFYPSSVTHFQITLWLPQIIKNIWLLVHSFGVARPSNLWYHSSLKSKVYPISLRKVVEMDEEVNTKAFANIKAWAQYLLFLRIRRTQMNVLIRYCQKSISKWVSNVYSASLWGLYI